MMTRSEQLFEEAVKLIPGGVNSPVRAFGSVGMTPRFIASAKGAYLTDADGNRYLDYVGSWGPMILGHNRREIREAVTEAAARASFAARSSLPGLTSPQQSMKICPPICSATARPFCSAEPLRGAGIPLHRFSKAVCSVDTPYPPNQKKPWI